MTFKYGKDEWGDIREKLFNKRTIVASSRQPFRNNRNIFVHQYSNDKKWFAKITSTQDFNFPGEIDLEENCRIVDSVRNPRECMVVYFLGEDLAFSNLNYVTQELLRRNKNTLLQHSYYFRNCFRNNK